MAEKEQNQETAVAVMDNRSLKSLLQGDAFKAAVRQALPKHMTAERFLRVAITALMRTPKLAQCTQDSFFKCLLDLSAMGLEPNGRDAHLIPFENSKRCACGHPHSRHQGKGRCLDCGNGGCGLTKNAVECTLIVDYKGIVQLVRRSEEVSYIHADMVYEDDDFDFTYGSGAFLRHRPVLSGQKRDPKKRLACYSFVKMRDGSEDFLVWGMGRVEEARQRSKAKDDGPWANEADFDAMAAKSVFRSQSKWLPLSSELRDKIEKGDDAIDIESDLPQFSGYDPEEFDSARKEQILIAARDGNITGALKMAKDWGVEVDLSEFKEKKQGHHHAESNGESKGESASPKSEPSAHSEEPETEATGKPGDSPLPDHLKELKAALKMYGEKIFWDVMGPAGFDDDNIGKINKLAVPGFIKEMSGKKQKGRF